MQLLESVYLKNHAELMGYIQRLNGHFENLTKALPDQESGQAMVKYHHLMALRKACHAMEQGLAQIDSHELWRHVSFDDLDQIKAYIHPETKAPEGETS